MSTANRSLNSRLAGLVLVYVLGALIGSAMIGRHADSLAVDLLGLIVLGMAGVVICSVGAVRRAGFPLGVVGFLLLVGLTMLGCARSPSHAPADFGQQDAHTAVITADGGVEASAPPPQRAAARTARPAESYTVKPTSSPAEKSNLPLQSQALTNDKPAEAQPSAPSPEANAAHVEGGPIYTARVAAHAPSPGQSDTDVEGHPIYSTRVEASAPPCKPENCLCVLAADDTTKQNTLTDRERAEGWILLFDGNGTKGWKVESGVRVADGVLVVGGQEAATIKSTDTFRKFELRFEYRREGTGLQPSIMGQPLFGAKRRDVWNEVILRAEQKGQRQAIWAADRETGVFFPTELTSDLTDERDTVPLDFKVPAGTRLCLRNVRLRR